MRERERGSSDHESMNNKVEKRRWRLSIHQQNRLAAMSEESRGWLREKGISGQWRGRGR